MSDYSKFFGHFIFGELIVHPPKGWNEFNLDNFTLVFHPSSELIPLFLNNKKVGFILGFIYDIESIFTKKNQERQLTLKTSDLIDFENLFYSLAGRFIGFVDINSNPRFYLDPSGGMPAIYSKREKTIASVPTLIKDEGYSTGLPPQLFSELGMPKRNLWFPGELTPFKNISRLLPNHFLDLQMWLPIRHWPNSDLSDDSTPSEVRVSRINNKLSQIFSTATQKNSLWLSLTAGRDSRMLLSTLKNNLESVRFFTFKSDKENPDEFLSRKVAQDLHLNWGALHIEEADETQKKQWIAKTGYAVSDTILNIHPTLRKIRRDGVVAPGMAGEVGRAFYWKKTDLPNTELTPKQLLSRLKLPTHSSFIESVDNWLKTVEDFDTLLKLDLAYIELRLGCWGMPQTYGHLELAEHFYPFSHRDIFLEMLTLDPETKRNELLFEKICAENWPELLNYPINRFTGLKRVLGVFQRIGRIPSYLKRRYGI